MEKYEIRVWREVLVKVVVEGNSQEEALSNYKAQNCQKEIIGLRHQAEIYQEEIIGVCDTQISSIDLVEQDE